MRFRICGGESRVQATDYRLQATGCRRDAAVPSPGSRLQAAKSFDQFLQGANDGFTAAFARVMARTIEQADFSAELDQVVNLGGRAKGDIQKAEVVAFASAGTAFRNICRN